MFMFIYNSSTMMPRYLLFRLVNAWINRNYVQVGPVMGDRCTWQIFLFEGNLIYNQDQSQPTAKSRKYIFIR